MPALHAISERVSESSLPGNPSERNAAGRGSEGTMSNTEQKSEKTGKHELSETTDRPEGTVDEDANPPLTDPTKAD